MAERETWIVDRFEGDLAVIEREGEATFNLPRDLLPAGTKEGDVLRVALSGSGEQRTWTLQRDPDETERRRQAVKRQVEDLRARDPGGDIAL